jgi:hypothetical protein
MAICFQSDFGAREKSSAALRCAELILDLKDLAAEAALNAVWVDEDIELFLSMALEFGASTNHHHFEPGGLVRHSLEVAFLALQDVKTWFPDPEVRYLAFVLALFDDVGKVFCYRIRCDRCQEEFGPSSPLTTEEFFNRHERAKLSVDRDGDLGPKDHNPFSQTWIDRHLTRRGILVGGVRETREVLQAVRWADRVSVARDREKLHRGIINRQLDDSQCSEFLALPEYGSYALNAINELSRLGFAKLGTNVWLYRELILVEFDELWPLVSGYIRAKYGSRCIRARREASGWESLARSLWGEGRLLAASDSLEFWVGLVVEGGPFRVVVLEREVYGYWALRDRHESLEHLDLRSPTGRPLKALKTIDCPKYFLNGEVESL